jgi:hypothetical protein
MAINMFGVEAITITMKYEHTVRLVALVADNLVDTISHIEVEE